MLKDKLTEIYNNSINKNLVDELENDEKIDEFIEQIKKNIQMKGLLAANNSRKSFDAFQLIPYSLFGKIAKINYEISNYCKNEGLLLVENTYTFVSLTSERTRYFKLRFSIRF